MDPSTVVSQGSLNALFNPDQGTFVPQPVLQCLQIKTLAPQAEGGPDRHRVVFSDIRNFVQTMLASQANWVVQQGKLVKGCFVRFKSFQANALKGKRIVIVLDIEVLEDLGVCERIGDPKPLDGRDGEDVAAQPTTISGEGFYGNRMPPQQQFQNNAMPTPQSSVPPRGRGGGGGGGGALAHATIFPIEGISPYAHKWTIKARCTHKGEIKHWHNKNGEGKLFGVNFLDDSGEIRATGFNEQCDSLYDVFQEGNVYYISSPCRVQLAKKQFSNVNNDYELQFEKDTLVEKAEDQGSVPQVRFNFTSISDLQTVEKDTTIDTIAVLKEVGVVSQITSKSTSKPYDKRELTLVDNTGYSVRLTIWGNTAVNFDMQEGSVIAFKGVKVSDFGGRSLSLLSSGSMTMNPDIDEAHKLKGWYDAGGKRDNFASHASLGMATGGPGSGKRDAFKTIAQVREENLGTSETPDYFSLKATIIYIKQENVSYPACLSEGCNKKVVDVTPDEWRCERCDKTHPKAEYRYIMSMTVSDHTGQFWLSAFDDVGRLIMGLSADELQVKKENDEKAAAEIFAEANCKTFIFRCRAKMDNYQEQQRVRYQIASASPLNYPAESLILADLLKLYNID